MQDKITILEVNIKYMNQIDMSEDVFYDCIYLYKGDRHKISSMTNNLIRKPKNSDEVIDEAFKCYEVCKDLEM